MFEILAQPFPKPEIDWQLMSVSKDSRRALVRPVIQEIALHQRLMLEDTGYALIQNTKDNHVECSLTVHGVTRSAIVNITATPEDAALKAFRATCAKFGAGRTLERIVGVWIDWDYQYNQALEMPVLPDWCFAAPETKAAA